MYAHNGTSIAGKIAATCCGRQIHMRLSAVGIDHVVTIGHVDLRCLRGGSGRCHEEFRQHALFKWMDGVHGEPATTARYDDSS